MSFSLINSEKKITFCLIDFYLFFKILEDFWRKKEFIVRAKILPKYFFNIRIIISARSGDCLLIDDSQLSRSTQICPERKESKS